MKIRGICLVVALISFLQVTGYADMVEGRVAQANAQALDVIVYDAQGRPYPNALRLQVDSRTQLNGISSVADLQPNDAIGADVRRQETGQWHADGVRLFQQFHAKPATKQTSPSLREVLGNPVVRGALLGAASGAIASSASGGKAGKGALVGAGVGAAAGLLQNIFEQKSNAQPDES